MGRLLSMMTRLTWVKRLPVHRLNVRMKLGGTTLTWGASWLLVLPAAWWAVAALYLPILGAPMDRSEDWAVAIVIVLLMPASLLAHGMAHVLVARMVRTEVPQELPMYVLGDAAQVWPAAPSPQEEALVALAGPVAQMLIAAVAYVLWNALAAPPASAVAAYLVFFNGAVALLNLTPAFPFDGGRLTRAILGWLLPPLSALSRLGLWLGLGMSGGFIAWGIFLATQRARFNVQTGIATFLLAGLMLLPLLIQRAWTGHPSSPAQKPRLWPLVWRAPIAGLLLLGLGGLSFCLLPTNYGLEAPGSAESVEPVVQIPAAYLHPSEGALLLTTVIPQTPILVGEWLYTYLNHDIRRVSPEELVPATITPQDLAQQQYQVLVDSETTAVIVGLRLAGYDASLIDHGVRITSVSPSSLAVHVLQAGDEIVSVNGAPVADPPDLQSKIQALGPQTSVQATISRDGKRMDVTIPLTPPTGADASPHIGISIEPISTEAKLPFPVKIAPKQVIGGPSAGLMFSLAVYDLLTQGDLTGGRTIAGTGTIDLDGNVGVIGGVQQKVVAAEHANAEYFLVPPDNYNDAVSVAKRIKVVMVGTIQEALQFLNNLPPVTKQ